MYFVTSSIKEYFKSHGNFSLTEDELIKFIEIFYVFYSITVHEDPIFSSDEVQENRNSICLKCSEYNSDDKSCNLCGCYIPDKIKKPQENCPSDKWVMDVEVLKKLILQSVRYISEHLNENSITIEEHQKIMSEKN